MVMTHSMSPEVVGRQQQQQQQQLSVDTPNSNSLEYGNNSISLLVCGSPISIIAYY